MGSAWYKLGRIDIKKEWKKIPIGNDCLMLSRRTVSQVMHQGNRQALHCSFANTSLKLEFSILFHRRSSILGAKGFS